MNDLLDRLVQETTDVTPEQLAAAAASLQPMQEGETRLVSVRDRPDIQRLWALAHEYDKRGARAIFDAKYVATSAQEKEAAVPKIAQLRAMEEVIRDIAWVAIKEIDPALHGHDCLGLREGFVVVKAIDPKARAHKKIEQMLRGPLAKLIGIQVVEGDAEDDDEEEPEEKIQ